VVAQFFEVYEEKNFPSRLQMRARISRASDDANLNAKINVLHLFAELHPSGMEKMLASAQPVFRSLGIRSFVVGQGLRHPFAQALMHSGVGVLEVPGRIFHRKNRRIFRSFVANNEIDVIHIHTEGQNLLSFLECRRALGIHARIVVTVHSIFDAKGAWRLSRWVQSRLVDRVVQTFVAPTEDVAAVERRVLKRRIEVIPNWVDDSFTSGQKSRDLLLSAENESNITTAVIVGNCAPVKRHELAFAAIQTLGHSVMHFGDEAGASPDELIQMNELELAGQLLHRGSGPPLTGLITGDYFIIPSAREGMSVALAEAITVGIPCIVADSPGLQWARACKGVEFVSSNKLSDDASASYIDAIQLAIGRRSEVPEGFDLTASRGAAQYAEVYRRLK
jgi:glycosyltransferase involved in cell wall biosynthesis